MPRRPRVHLDGVPLHIAQRGHNREPCFLVEEDYSTSLHWLGEALGEAECKLHAYVLMTNHVHLLLTPKKAQGVPRLVIFLGRRYVQYINRSYRRTGTLWDSRYKSSLIQAETYLLACQRYIELNPVRAAMVDDLTHYRWSSYVCDTPQHCGGQDWSREPWYGNPILGPGIPRVGDRFNPGRCEKILPDNQCMNDCLAKEIDNPNRAPYGVLPNATWSIAPNCQEWAVAIVQKCRSGCLGKK